MYLNHNVFSLFIVKHYNFIIESQDYFNVAGASVEWIAKYQRIFHKLICSLKLTSYNKLINNGNKLIKHVNQYYEIYICLCLIIFSKVLRKIQS